jgi:hypothetical protein
MRASAHSETVGAGAKMPVRKQRQVSTKAVTRPGYYCSTPEAEVWDRWPQRRQTRSAPPAPDSGESWPSLALGIASIRTTLVGRIRSCAARRATRSPGRRSDVRSQQQLEAQSDRAAAEFSFMQRLSRRRPRGSQRLLGGRVGEHPLEAAISPHDGALCEVPRCRAAPLHRSAPRSARSYLEPDGGG